MLLHTSIRRIEVPHYTPESRENAYQNIPLVSSLVWPVWEQTYLNFRIPSAHLCTALQIFSKNGITVSKFSFEILTLVFDKKTGHSASP